MKSFKQEKLSKERGLSPKDLLENALRDVEEIDEIVLSIKFKDDGIITGVSYEHSLSALGLLEVSKADILKDMEE